ncbi:GH92 family glycosyl hydrolase [Chitinophagaceae bacterium LB-8]|uniref:GH92 family glycosyl hydrolase n=1 Tax=Paraflavisolibacter caeni TaxID=2982496 RepID=A0A9X2XTL6_9BACT|nr:GH92 family glycosyl hydrolase [Paraflavisolibacter caeni]MCU7548786.1 GH92 family glycosyl hydrolase [Paraflavisolibacter caeni]
MLLALKYCKRAFISLILCLLLLDAASQVSNAASLIDMVNPLMGTASKNSLSTGNTYPAIALPWGMNFWVPQTGKMGDGWVYTYDAEKIRGFKQTHQPSPWINDYGQFSLMPVTGKLKFREDERASWFSHKAETAKPYFYSVYLADHDVVTEIAPTERAASFRFTFPQTDSAFVVLDAFDKGSFVKIIPSENKIIGYTTKNSGGVPTNFRNYFVLYFDKSFDITYVWHDSILVKDALEIMTDHAGAAVGFKTRKGERVNVRAASSFVSYEQAELNLQRELGKNEFETVKQKAKNVWEKEFSRIKVEGGTDDQIRTFYSCLYRTMLFPRKFYELDANGKVIHYSPYNGKVLPGYMFTDNGFWDTFRAVFPLFNLIFPSLNAQIQEGLVNAYKESGWLPEWASPGHRDCMIGSNSASIITDAYLKGIRGYDINILYEALLKNSENEGPLGSVGRKGVGYYNQLGYVPYNVGINENAARTLEYAYADYCLYLLAKELKRPAEEIERFAKRAQNYRNLFDPSHNLMRGKNSDGAFMSPFNPFKWGDAFTEGNSWHYTWSVFHDVQGLISLMGGEKSFVKMLDSVFKVPPIFDATYYGSVIHEIREMQIMNMGNYAHGNQPIQHMIYLYNYAGEPWKTQYWVREVMSRLYSPTPDGYCGDEDNGQTSAWYVFSALGFYPVCPGTDQYILGTPLFPKVTLKLESGKTIAITAPSNNKENKYIQSLSVNGRLYRKNWISHKTLMQGATLNFSMTALPNKERGANTDAYPYSFSGKKEF